MSPRKGGSEGNRPSPSKVSAHTSSHLHSYPLPSFVTCHQHIPLCPALPSSQPLKSHQQSSPHPSHTSRCQSIGVGVAGHLKKIRLLECLSYKPFRLCQHLSRVAPVPLSALLQISQDCFPTDTFWLHRNGLLGIESSWRNVVCYRIPIWPQCITARLSRVSTAVKERDLSTSCDMPRLEFLSIQLGSLQLSWSLFHLEKVNFSKP